MTKNISQAYETNKTNPKFITFFAILLVVIGPMSIDLYLPALPRMADIFGEYVALSIGIFTIGIGIGQIFFGPWSDKYGRRPIILIGIGIFTSCSLAIQLLDNELWALLGLRFIQGLGASATSVSCTAMIRDTFDGAKLAQRYSIVSASLNVIPALAPSLGALLFEYWDWHSAFVFLALYGLLVGTIFIFFFKETRKKAPTSTPNLTWIFLAKHRILVTYTLCCASSLSLILSYVGSASHILMGISGVNKNTFALYFGFNAFLTILANLAAARLVMRIKQGSILKMGLLFWGTSGILMIAFYDSINPISYMIPIAILSIGIPFVLGPANSLAMHSFKIGAGRAAAFIGCVQMIVGSGMSMIIHILPVNLKISLGGMSILLCIICFITVSITHAWERKQEK